VNKKWRASTHAISDIRDWNRQGILILQPDYQRKEVWADAAKMMLVDSILNGIPMPKIFVSSEIKDGRTVRTVIDGQQRITTILSFLAEGFILTSPYDGVLLGCSFSQMPLNSQEEFLSYDIDFNEAKGLLDEELREVYSRINKYFVPLNKQELRKADYPGDFLALAENLATLDFFDDCAFFNATARRRSLDVEYVSELLAGILLGISDRKDAIDICCKTYRQWDDNEKTKVYNEFKDVLFDIEQIFSNENPIKKTRWKQKSDFYSLFFAVRSLRAEGFSLADDLSPLRSDLLLLDEKIAPTAEIPILSKYAIYCVSQANSSSSRSWRTYFLKAILRGTYSKSIDDLDQKMIIMEIASSIRIESNPEWNRADVEKSLICPVCDQPADSDTLSSSVLFWKWGTSAFQLSNAAWAHVKCIETLEFDAIIKGAEFPDVDDDDSWDN
jgi:hypothetical protein